MNKIAQLLGQKVATMKEAISGQDSDKSWDLVKAAAAAQLEEQGVSDAQSLIDSLAKEAGFNDTQASIGAFPFNAEEVIELFEKSAAYIEELQAKIDAKDSKISVLQDDLEKTANVNNAEIVEKLIAKGFSEEEVDSLTSLSSDVLSKVASLSSEGPWEMGHGARQAEDGMDPIMKFLNS